MALQFGYIFIVKLLREATPGNIAKDSADRLLVIYVLPSL